MERYVANTLQRRKSCVPPCLLNSFRLCIVLRCQDAAVAWHKHSPHGHRLTTIKGKSQDTVPQYAKQHPELKCDIVHVDGDHISPNAYVGAAGLGCNPAGCNALLFLLTPGITCPVPLQLH